MINDQRRAFYIFKRLANAYVLGIFINFKCARVLQHWNLSHCCESRDTVYNDNNNNNIRILILRKIIAYSSFEFVYLPRYPQRRF